MTREQFVESYVAHWSENLSQMMPGTAPQYGPNSVVRLVALTSAQVAWDMREDAR